MNLTNLIEVHLPEPEKFDVKQPEKQEACKDDPFMWCSSLSCDDKFEVGLCRRTCGLCGDGKLLGEF